MNNEKLTTYSLAAIGALQGILRYYVLAPVRERLCKPDLRHIGMLSNAEIDLVLCEPTTSPVPESGDQ